VRPGFELPMSNHPHVILRGENAIQALLLALKPLSNLRGTVPLRFVLTFLTVASDEGKGVCAYARALGVHRAITSRYLHALGDRARDGGPGLGLIRSDRDPEGSNGQRIFLTEKGQALVAEVFQNIRRQSNIAA
jgi:DNA-binding MarR family transcriptional regulator